jgi:hypothetical protein
MTTVFIGGSRRIGRLNGVIRARIDDIVERGLRVVIGDANGSDRAVQAFLAEKGHKNAVVYCMEGICRNNVGGWPVCVVQGAGERGFGYYALKDAEMAGCESQKECGALGEAYQSEEVSYGCTDDFFPDKISGRCCEDH